MLCIKLGHLLSVCAGVSQAQSMGVCTHLECMLSVVVKTDRQEEYNYAHTYNMTPTCQLSVSSYQMFGAVLLCLHKLYEF